MTGRLVIEIGEPGHSDLVLYELEHVGKQMGCTPHQAALMLIGVGLATLQARGTITRATPAGSGLDPNWRPPPADTDVVAFPIQRDDAEILLRALVFSPPPSDEREQQLAVELLQRLKVVTGIKRS